MVSIDGFRFFGDGEIRSGKQVLVTDGCWPGLPTPPRTPLNWSAGGGAPGTVEPSLPTLRLRLEQVNREASASTLSLSVLDARMEELETVRNDLQSRISEFQRNLVFVDESEAVLRRTDEERAALAKDLQHLQDVTTRRDEAHKSLESWLCSLSLRDGVDGHELCRRVEMRETHRHKLLLLQSQHRCVIESINLTWDNDEFQ